VFWDHLESLRGALTAAVNAFNKAVGSFETRLLPGIRRFRDLGATAAEPIPPLDVVEPTPRCSGLCPKPEKLRVKMEAKSDGPDLVQIKHRGTSPAIGHLVSAESREQPSEPSPVDPTAKPEGLSCPGA